MPSTQARKDPLTGRWILVATDGEPRLSLTTVDITLPDAPTGEGEGPWVHVPEDAVLDRTAPVDRQRIGDGLFMSATSAGRHARIVSADDQLGPALIVCRDKMLEFADDNRSRQLGAVRNHGAAAGASSASPTIDVYALPFVPDEMRQKLTAFTGHYRRAGSCLLCDMIRFERTETGRVLEESLRHVAFLPWASASPYEVVIAPKGHHPNYMAERDLDLGDLAGLLERTIERIRLALGGPAYKFVLATAPLDAGADVGHFHWHFRITPMLVWASALDGIAAYNPVSPKLATAALSKVML